MTRAEYWERMAKLSRLMDLNPVLGTKDSERLVELAEAIEKYELENWPIVGCAVRLLLHPWEEER